MFWIIEIGDLKLCKELKEKLLGSDREGIGLRLGRYTVIELMADLNQIADLKLSVLAPVKFRSRI